MSSSHICPVCGFPGLYEEPWVDDAPSDEICPACGTHFGFDDVSAGEAGRRQQVWRARRLAWQSSGRKWFSKRRPKPLDWNPEAELPDGEEP
jgi:hypothetical protein